MKRDEMLKDYLQLLDLHNHELDFTFLCDLVARHVAAYPFSSAGCQLGDDLPLDYESLYQRIIILRRGGYCFEHNGLLFEILKDLGLTPKLYLARVIHNQDIHPGLTHRISIIEYEGNQYVIDVGFGASGPRVPVLMSETESRDGDRFYRIAEVRPSEFHMQILKDGEFFSLYRFELCRYGQADCELGHFYSHRHPAANFVNHLVVTRLTKATIHSLLNLEYWQITQAGTEKQQIHNPEYLQQILTKELNLQVNEDECRNLFEKISARQ